MEVSAVSATEDDTVREEILGDIVVADLGVLGIDAIPRLGRARPLVEVGLAVTGLEAVDEVLTDRIRFWVVIGEGDGVGVVADLSLRGVPRVDGVIFLGFGFDAGVALAGISSHCRRIMSVFVAHCMIRVALAKRTLDPLTVMMDPFPLAHWVVPVPPAPPPESCNAFRSSSPKSACLLKSLILNCRINSPAPTSYARTIPSIVIESNLS